MLISYFFIQLTNFIKDNLSRTHWSSTINVPLWVDSELKFSYLLQNKPVNGTSAEGEKKKKKKKKVKEESVEVDSSTATDTSAVEKKKKKKKKIKTEEGAEAWFFQF